MVEIILVIVLGAPEFRQRCDLGDDRVVVILLRGGLGLERRLVLRLGG